MNPADEKPERKPLKFMYTPHPQGCTCARCDLSPIQCPVYEGGQRCTATPRGRRALGSHVAWMHKRRKRKMAAILQPDGLGYLTKVLVDPLRMYGLDLSALPRFSRTLTQSNVLGATERRRNKRGRAATRYLLERAQANLDGFVQMPAFVAPGKLVEPIAQLARVADVSTGTVVDALLAYGLELLAKELRQSRTAPDPFIPGVEAPKPPTQNTTPLFPTG
jgi:hypothetical protein